MNCTRALLHHRACPSLSTTTPSHQPATHLLVDALAGGGGAQRGDVQAQRLGPQLRLRLLAPPHTRHEQLRQCVLPARSVKRDGCWSGVRVSGLGSASCNCH